MPSNRLRSLVPQLLGGLRAVALACALGSALSSAGGCAGSSDLPPADAAPPAAGHDHAAAGHDHAAGGGHMEAMIAQRERLQATLGPAYISPVPGLEGASAERGAARYATHCATCHGASGRGDGPAGAGLTPAPADFTDALHARFYSDAGRVQIIRAGSPGTAMAAFGGTLTEPEILDLYAFVATFRGAAGAEGAAPTGGTAADGHGAHPH